jgi:hypothetical protein
MFTVCLEKADFSYFGAAQMQGILNFKEMLKVLELEEVKQPQRFGIPFIWANSMRSLLVIASSHPLKGKNLFGRCHQKGYLGDAVVIKAKTKTQIDQVMTILIDRTTQTLIKSGTTQNTNKIRYFL